MKNLQYLFIALAVLLMGSTNYAPKENNVVVETVASDNVVEATPIDDNFYWATLCINYPNSNGPDIRDTLCDYWGYTGAPGDNAAKLEFVRSRAAKHLKDEYAAAKANQASEAARIASIQTSTAVDIN